VFRGSHAHAIDAKGRTSLPSRFRDLISADGDCRVVMTRSLERCVLTYSLTEWSAFEQKLAAAPQFDPLVNALRTVYINNAFDTEVDKMGRLLIPSALREYAGLTRDVVWTGSLKYIELWDKARLEQKQEAILADPEKVTAIARRMAELGL
jgi:MraZ protein